MESTVAALLLVTSTVVLSCFVVIYTVNTITQTFSGDSQTVHLYEDLQKSMLNSTFTDGSTIQIVYPTPTPTPVP